LFERFTERARQVVVLAREEATTFKHDHIGTEHLLLGLLREQEGIGARALDALGITLEQVRGEVVRIVGVGDHPEAGQIPFTQDAKRVLELALREALPLGHNYIGTEHILLGLVSLTEGPSVQILSALKVTPDAIRAETLRLIGPTASTVPEAAGHVQMGWRGGEGFHVNPGSGVRRLMMIAGARALEDGRSVIEPRDVLRALTRDEHIGPLLAELGATEAEVLKALTRRRPPEAPPPQAGAPEPD
jgi:ATP-dependent Clp protease ATP-binding subunit ClpC